MLPSLSLPAPLPLPAPLRANETPSFTNYSVAVRLPEIARRTLAENTFDAQTSTRIQALIDEIPHGNIRPVEAAGPCAANWPAWIAPHLGKNWLDVPWFFAEEYFYLRILEAVDYFAPAGFIAPASFIAPAGFIAPGAKQARDPYARQKRLGLESSRANLRDLAGHSAAALEQPAGEWRATLERVLLMDLWGNQNDLSMWPVKSGEKSGGKAGQSSAGGSAADAAGPSANEHILNNEMGAVLAYLGGLPPGAARIDLLLDNAGYELAADLALADYLLASGRAAEVTLHAKCQPVFVSDALDYDIHATIDFLAWLGDAAALAMAVRLRMNLLSGRLRVQQHPMWTSPLPAWEMPSDLRESLAAVHLLIVKGDANYRRLLGDRHWPYDLPFSAVVNYLPCATLALRTLKSEITLGVTPERVPAGDPQWMTNGRWGLVQFAPPLAGS